MSRPGTTQSSGSLTECRERLMLAGAGPQRPRDWAAAGRRQAGGGAGHYQVACPWKYRDWTGLGKGVNVPLVMTPATAMGGPWWEIGQ